LSDLPAKERAIRQKLKDDFRHYAERCLSIRAKDGSVERFRFNKAQIYLDDRLEEQRGKIGRVRAIILKGRQQGCSTYVGGRFYHKTTHRKGCRCFILTHEQDATNNLFGMVERYHENCPSLVRPETGAANAKELSFSALDSGYAVGTAGTKAVGRSQTIQLFHGSEVAFWPNAATHFAGVVQAIPDLPGTEIILESTANGPAGEFYERWQMAEAGIGDYIAIFIPWLWQDEYRRPVPDDFVPTEEEQEYMALHGADLEQIVWRRAKIAELKDPMLFMQEYPATAAEAFQTTGHDSYIESKLVLRARKTRCAPHGPLIIGADPARFGDDRFSLAWRQGRKVLKIESRTKLDTVAGANWIKTVIDRDKPARVFVDVGGIGAGVIDILHSWGEPYLSVVIAVNFGSPPQDEPMKDENGQEIGGGPRNRRAEMWMRSKEWLEEIGGADIPDTDVIQADAVGPGYKYDMQNRLLLESKEDMRKRGIRSPDEWDAVALTFAAPVVDRTGWDKPIQPLVGTIA
jgi:hypothetical protein